MAFLAAYHTDIGTKKSTNQDALLLKTAKTPKGEIGLFVVCDGMGGLSHGELASATVIRGLSEWFDQELPELVYNDTLEELVCLKLEECLKVLNEKILQYGNNAYIQLGTTVTALLVVYSTYYIAQIGDSRAYRIDRKLEQLTKDQTLVERELERGNITEQEANVHPKRNVLLQCVGASKEIDVVFTSGEIEAGTLYLLCSDGFHHQLSKEELYNHFKPGLFSNEQQMKEKIIEVIDLVKSRNEKDNISALVTVIQ
ncbi:MAG: PP2C family protein-serine/threonine phosphatase [Anaerobacillus sp.]|uniref:PP2C family protein-serine/threonine phosphatase n=1 Tax=Anaerobacillus sp. TaxID=1872506 RepID=UPI00391CD9EA